ncbi:MAG: GNAT family N-acetyltransferase [Defluviitaleaceae bacterium]|nr:GNAT family N-acetyltransferase [Defluviitaleaceae bacterium]
MIRIVCVKEYPQYLEAAADYFSAIWKVDKQLYVDSMTESLTADKPYPRWYIMFDEDEIIGGCGVVDDDFMADSDFCPWLCALFVDPDCRGEGLGARLLNHAVKEAGKAGLDVLYLNTDHTGYYEKCGWQYVGDFPHINGDSTRVYSIKT